jgi:16S rRNA (cytidine1402-2'-O)-methyltransferase
MPDGGILYIVATPIGNLEDITLRALRVLKEVDLIAAEDTRRTRQLLAHYDIHTPLVSYHSHNLRSREAFLLRELRQGKRIALVTDAGTPGISDPGEHLVQRAIEESIALVPIPGPSAFVAALSVSGLPTHRFLFSGFLPSQPSGRRKFLESLRDRPETLLFYESPRRIRKLLEEAQSILGQRRVVVAREITKVFEEVYRGTIREVLERLGEGEMKGEVTVVIEGSSQKEKALEGSPREALLHYHRELGLSMKEAIDRLASETGLSKRELYRESLKMKAPAKEPPPGDLPLPENPENRQTPESGSGNP